MRDALRGWKLLGWVLLALLLLAGCGHAWHALTSHGAWCAFHGWRAYHDLKLHHPFWTGFQLWRAAHHCAAIL